MDKKEIEKLFQETLDIYKLDLNSKTVGEFPELQGIMGSIFAQKAGYSSLQCEAIALVYNESIDTANPIAIKLYVFDRLANIVDGILINQSKDYTSSKDPFKIRRNAIEIVKCFINCQDVFKEFVDLNNLIKSYVKQDFMNLNKDNFVIQSEEEAVKKVHDLLLSNSYAKDNEEFKTYLKV